MSQWLRKYNIIGLLLGLLLIQIAHPARADLSFPKVLGPDEAFQLDLTHHDATLNLNWHISPECYLYRESITVELIKNDKKSFSLLNETTLPQGKSIQDPTFGEQVIYTHFLTLDLDLNEVLKASNHQPLIIEVNYQGCSETGFCYPPMTKFFKITSQNQKIEKITSYHNEQATLETETKAEKSRPSSLPSTAATFYFLGLLLSFTPCVLPMIPILFVVIVGQGHLNTRRAFSVSLCYVLSMATTYAIAGIIVAKIGKNLQALMQKPLVLIIFAAFFVYLGFMQLGIGKISLPSKWRDWLHAHHTKQSSGTYIGAIVMGILATLIASPCVSAPMMGALLYISQSNDMLLGGTALFALGLGMGTPLIAIGTLEGKFLPKKGPWMHTINKIFALILFGLSIWLLGRLLPGPVTLALWGLLSLLTAIWMGTFSLQPNRSGRFGVLFLVYAGLLFWGSWHGNENPLNPLCMNSWQIFSPALPKSKIHFETIDSLDGLNEQLILIEKHQEPLLMVVHADWCASCKNFERQVLADPQIQKKLSNYRRVAVDVTKNDEANQLFLKKFDLVGPPAVLFFDKNKNELPKYRIIGDISSHAFSDHLDKVDEKLRE